MVCPCSDFGRHADAQFTKAKAVKELNAYRKGKIGPTTRLLRDAIVRTGLNRGTLLDIGAGVGALSFELLDRGLSSAVLADASAAYVTAATEEATRRGRSTSVQVMHGDVLQITLPQANIVTLDRVVCCYPSYDRLLRDAVTHADEVLGFSYPRDRWYVRAMMWLENARRARKSGFRTFVHPPARMQAIVTAVGFELAERRSTIAWTVDVFVKRQVEPHPSSISSSIAAAKSANGRKRQKASGEPFTG